MPASEACLTLLLLLSLYSHNVEGDQSSETCAPGTRYCKNGGTCMKTSINLTCSCPTQYTGVRCELKLLGEPCASGTVFCKNGGTCITNYDSIKHVCKCAYGYGGARCEQSYCNCMNGGTCSKEVNYDNIYYCRCASGFTGSSCQTLENEKDDGESGGSTGKWVGVGIGVTLIIVIIAAVIVGIVLMWMKRGKSVEVEKTGGQPEGSFGYSKQEDDVTHMGFGTAKGGADAVTQPDTSNLV
ncbi:sushi, nidogen and EGF-like domain-containing protein 1 [Corticium candelabrum]|uniref:sushi, nidogen and EGF-like domain-containing protein 1 n=1 Tax=Corticium candelabrum TaxID=121492 RepID=UPI002E26DFA4|nr:sushi, nidogen and EGF-like domain-containing protein 1 [Corticium candelabrum]